VPELIRAGHLFIAQPPLYKVTRGRSEVYLKDEAALEDYLVSGGVSGLSLTSGADVRSGGDLTALVEHARRMKRLMAYVPRRYPAPLVEALALAGALDPAVTDQAAAARRLADWLNAGSSGWTAEPGAEGGFVVRHLDRGVTDAFVIDRAFVSSAEARKLNLLAAEQAAAWAGPATLASDAEQAKGTGLVVRRPSELLGAIMDAGRKGLAVQRYKGLGEMNAEQLWETTLDPSARTLLKVEIGDAYEADETFTKLMGDIVEPRREFIQLNALSVANLDI
jgi:DNA gyrase subunit B